MTIDLVNFSDVDILEEGTYACDSGVHTFTREDLESAVKAAQEDPAVKDPRLKLGHVGEHGSVIGLPAVGRVQNMRLVETDGKMKIKGDIVGVPAWLADIMPTAYPNRSIEGNWEVTTSSGKTHEFVIRAVSNLGVDLPAVETLEDLQVVFEEGPDGLRKAQELVVAQYRADAPVTEVKANQKEEARGMTPEQIALLRSKHRLTEEQLPDDATEEQITAALQGLPDPEAEESEEEGTEAEEEEEETETESETEDEEVAVAAQLDPEALKELQADAKAGREARAQQVRARQSEKVEAAINKGKIPPAQRKHYRALMSKNEEGTTTFLDGLEEGVVPVKDEEKGSGNDGEAAAASAAASGVRGWFPELNKQEKETV
jgi:hypothetical protein